MHDVFVSHSSSDKQLAHALVHHLEAQKIRCWVAPRDITAGKSYAEAILEGLEGAELMILVLSGAANASPHVQREVERALSLGRTVVPVRVEDVSPSGALDYFISSVHWIDAFDHPLEDRFELLAEHVRALISCPGGAEVPSQPVPAPAPPVPEAPPTPSSTPASAPSKASPLVLVLVLLLLATLAGGGWWIFGRNADPGVAEGERSEAHVEVNAPPVIDEPPVDDGEMNYGGAAEARANKEKEARIEKERERLEEIEAKLQSLCDEMSDLQKDLTEAASGLALPQDLTAGTEPLSEEDAGKLRGQIEGVLKNLRAGDIDAERLVARAEVMAGQVGTPEESEAIAALTSRIDALHSTIRSDLQEVAGLAASSFDKADQLEKHIKDAMARIPEPVVPSTVPKAGEPFENAVGRKMVWVAAIGGWADAHEMTQESYREVTSVNPSQHRGSGRLPVDSVSWVDAVGFCKRLTDREREKGYLPEGFVYRLPSDQEWSALAQGTTKAMAVFSASRNNKREHPQPVGSLAANPQGLYDVLGNIFEWCHNDFDRSMNTVSANASMSTIAPDGKVVRGGSYRSYSAVMQSISFRASDRPNERHHTVGLRVVLAKPLD